VRAWAAFAASAVVLAVVLLVLAAVLPDRVPLHFGPSLEPDAVGDRGTFLALAAGAGALVAGLLGGLAASMSRVPLGAVNVPHAAYWKTPEREPVLRRRLRDDLLVIGSLTLLLLAVVFALTGEAAVDDSRLSPWAYAVLAVYVVAVLGYCVHLFTRRYRPPPS
jgi:uncharacterized BrkB/YihY/UPF0761 family membrane protein